VRQILPVNPTTCVYQNSPYLGASTYACNPLRASPELLSTEGLLDRDELPSPEFAEDRIDYAAVARLKQRRLDRAWTRFEPWLPSKGSARFCAKNIEWSDDHALTFPRTVWFSPARMATIRSGAGLKMKPPLWERGVRGDFQADVQIISRPSIDQIFSQISANRERRGLKAKPRRWIVW
jgi:hypothetical protein